MPHARIRFVAALAAVGGLCLVIGAVASPAIGAQGFLDQSGDRAHENDERIRENARRLINEGRDTFRFDTFGSETFFGDTLQLHKAVEGSAHGGVGGGRGHVLAQRALRACPNAGAHGELVGQVGQHDHGRARPQGQQLSTDFDVLGICRARFEQNQVRSQGAAQVERPGGVAGLADHLQAHLGVDQGAQPQPHEQA